MENNNPTTGTGSMGGGSSTGPTGSSTVTTGAGATGIPTEICEHCGASLTNPTALEQLLSRLGLNEQMIDKLKKSLADTDVDEYVATAREYLKKGGDKAANFTKENPGKVAAGVAVLAVGAGLVISALNRDKE